MHTAKYFIILFFFLLNGCTALHVPQSEVILIETPPEQDELAAGFSLNSGIWSREVKSYAIEEHRAEGLKDEIARRNFYGLSLTGLLWANTRSAMGISFFSGGVGLDYTLGFSEKVYLTVMGNVARNFEGIIQTPIYRNRKTGLTVGAFYRNERHGLLEKCTSYWCIGNEIGSYFRISAIGIRLNQYLDDTEARGRIRFSIGYSPEVKGAIITAGIYSPLPRRFYRKDAF